MLYSDGVVRRADISATRQLTYSISVMRARGQGAADTEADERRSRNADSDSDSVNLDALEGTASTLQTADCPRMPPA